MGHGGAREFANASHRAIERNSSIKGVAMQMLLSFIFTSTKDDHGFSWQRIRWISIDNNEHNITFFLFYFRQFFNASAAGGSFSLVELIIVINVRLHAFHIALRTIIIIVSARSYKLCGKRSELKRNEKEMPWTWKKIRRRMRIEWKTQLNFIKIIK